MISFDDGKSKVSQQSQHPLQVISEQLLHKQQIEKKEMMAKMFGIHSALRQEMDEYVIRQSQTQLNFNKKRVPFSLEVLLGRDETIDNFDVFNVPSFVYVFHIDFYTHTHSGTVVYLSQA